MTPNPEPAELVVEPLPEPVPLVMPTPAPVVHVTPESSSWIVRVKVTTMVASILNLLAVAALCFVVMPIVAGIQEMVRQTEENQAIIEANRVRLEEHTRVILRLNALLDLAEARAKAAEKAKGMP